MGVNVSKERINKLFVMKSEDFEIRNRSKTPIGVLSLAVNKTRNQKAIHLSIQYDNDQIVEKVTKALEVTSIQSSSPSNCFVNSLAAGCPDQMITCSASFLDIYLEPFDFTLEDLFVQNKINEFFDQEYKIWVLVAKMIESVKELNKSSESTHSLHPRLICYFVEKAEWRIIHPSFVPNFSNFQLAFAGENHYCAPEVFSQLGRNYQKFKLEDKDRASMFSIGLIVLRIMIEMKEKMNFAKIYHKPQYSVDFMYLAKLLISLESKGLSDLLLRIVNDLLQEIDIKRPSSEGISEHLNPFWHDLSSQNMSLYEQILETYLNTKSTNLAHSSQKEGTLVEQPSSKVEDKGRLTILGEKKDSIEQTSKLAVKKQRKLFSNFKFA